MWPRSNFATPAVVAISFCLIGGTVSAAAKILHVPVDDPTIQAGNDAGVTGGKVVDPDIVYLGDGNRDLDFNGKWKEKTQ